jgi:hypothetical protein
MNGPGQRAVCFDSEFVQTQRSSVTSPMHAADTSTPEFRLPTRREAWWFQFRASGFRALRLLRNLVDRDHRRHRTLFAANRELPVIAESVTRLWPSDVGSEEAWAIGKIENLRVARLAFDGIELAAGEVLSFWAQLGRPSRGRGFVAGRELREGCLIPTIGGGLCQLSNALYAAAFDAGLEIVERHTHSKTIPGSQAARDRDATVFWNYVDLRFRAPYALRFEVEMDADALRVRIRSAAADAMTHRRTGGASAMPAHETANTTKLVNDSESAPSAHALRNCGSCGMTACFRNAPASVRGGSAIVLADRIAAEEEAYLQTHAADAERPLLAPSLMMRLRARAFALHARLRKAPIGERIVAQARLRAEAARAALQPHHTTLYIDQTWLPVLWRSGALAGRRYQVLMRGLPMTALHATLETAAAVHPNEPTLRDFRADPGLLEAETLALAGAERWLSAHAEVLALAGTKAHALPWQLPQARAAERITAVDTAARDARSTAPLRVYFPASSLVRKGALELAAALRGFGGNERSVELILPAHDGGEAARWDGIAIRRIADLDDALGACDVVALPAWVEHQPRPLLAAIARGVPVIATAACGLGALPGWRYVPTGDAGALLEALRAVSDDRDRAEAPAMATGSSRTRTAIPVALQHAPAAPVEA